MCEMIMEKLESPFMIGICFSSCGFGFTCQIQRDKKGRQKNNRRRSGRKKCNEFLNKNKNKLIVYILELYTE